MSAFLCHLCTDYKTHCPLGYFILKGTLGALHKYTEFQFQFSSTVLSNYGALKCVWNDIISSTVGCVSVIITHTLTSHEYHSCVSLSDVTFWPNKKKGVISRQRAKVHRQQSNTQNWHSSEEKRRKKKNQRDVCLCNWTPEFPGSRPPPA